MKTFVCGFPVNHSRSPLIHNYWLEKYGIKGSYEKITVSPENFSQFVSGLSENGFIGGNVTLPHKEQAFLLVDEPDEVSSKIGAVNTIWISNKKLFGSNTDAYGFLANLDQEAKGWDKNANVKSALVLGAGGASRAILYALLQREFGTVYLANRTLEKAENLAQRFGKRIKPIRLDETGSVMQQADVLVNTTSIGLDDSDEYPFTLENLPETALVTDIVYTPLETGLLRLARKRSLHTVDGLGMLLHQAVPGFEKWFGTRPQVTNELRQILLSDLGEKS